MSYIKTVAPMLIAAAMVVFFGLLVGMYFQSKPADASVNRFAEYTATTTASSNMYGANVTFPFVIATATGSIGSVVITGAATGIVNVYNATTTDVTKRTGNVATSSILIASFPASTVAGVYTIDSLFSTGLLIDIPSGTAPTTTITYRLN